MMHQHIVETACWLVAAGGLTAAIRTLFKPSYPPADMPEPETIDLSTKAWGQNYNILSVDGRKMKLAIWSTPLPEAGDFLLLRDDRPSSPDGKTRYRVTQLRPCYNPSDMAFADVEFQPRERQ